MKNHLYFFMLLSLIGSTSIHAQEKFVYGDETAFQTISFKPCRLKDSLHMGNSNITVKYHMKRKINDNEFRWCTLKLMICDSMSSQIDLHDYANSLIMTDFNNGKTEIDKRLIEMGMENGDASSNLFLQMVRDDKRQTLQVTSGDMQLIDRTKMYEEPIPPINWNITDTTHCICGYGCIMATTRFRGRTWNAWFTVKIPIGLGPWKLWGLPGLILKAEDESGEYGFECIELSAEKYPVFVYDYPDKQILSRQQYIKYEKNSYMQPYELFANGEDVIVWKKNADGSVNKIKESWTVPYYPIELE